MRGPRWQREQYRLPKNHGWKAKPGYVIFVADAGAVRFDIPEKWIVEPGADSIKFHDRKPPDDDCLLQFSLMRLNPDIDWTGLPLEQTLLGLFDDDSRGLERIGDVVELRRNDLEVVWFEGRFVDENEGREALTRACLARRGTIMPFITMDFWPEDAPRFTPVWDEVVRTLRLGDYGATKGLTGNDPRYWASTAEGPEPRQ